MIFEMINGNQRFKKNSKNTIHKNFFQKIKSFEYKYKQNIHIHIIHIYIYVF